MTHKQSTNTIKSKLLHKIGLEDALNMVAAKDGKADVYDVANRLEANAIHSPEPILNDSDKLELANYILDYHVDWYEVAEALIEKVGVEPSGGMYTTRQRKKAREEIIEEGEE
ncbi:MAG: hypothetical protein KAJ07_04640 [Planctomycetes bacterium]|nr:hypothetical protein [Planctomycetota bacterium]